MMGFEDEQSEEDLQENEEKEEIQKPTKSLLKDLSRLEKGDFDIFDQECRPTKQVSKNEKVKHDSETLEPKPLKKTKKSKDDEKGL